MEITKKRILNLLKIHINYLSILIVFVGLAIKFSFSSLFPLLNKIDIKFFGEILIEFGILLLIGNWLLDKYKEEVNEILFSEIIDRKMGLKGAPLLTELVNLINPFSYNVGLYEVSCIIKKINKNSKKYDIIQTKKLSIYPKQNNVYYIFGTGSTEKDKPPKIVYIKLNNKELILSKELGEVPSPYVVGPGMTNYKILIPLKAERKYDIEMKTIYPSCMSDLSEDIEFDFHEYTYFALTERILIKHKYFFQNFQEYEFKAEKTSMNLPDVEEIECKPNLNSKEIILESGNLKNGDRICITYKKKKS